MGLTLPWALVALVAAALPVIAHLVRRRDLPVVALPTIALLARARAQSRRRARLVDLLLLAARIALVAAAALALAGPFLTERLAYGDGRRATVAIVIDDSASMGVRGGTRATRAPEGDAPAARGGAILENAGRTETALARAAARADAAIDALPVGSEVAVVLAGAPARVLVPRTASLDTARRAVRALAEAPPVRGTDLGGALALAARELATGRNATRRALVLSDFAAHARAGEAELPDDVTLDVERVGVAAGTVTNAAIGAVEVADDPAAPAQLSVAVEVRAWGESTGTRWLRLERAGEVLARAEVALVSGVGRAVLRAPSPDDADPRAWLTLEGEDALAVDDRRGVLLRPRAALRTLLIGPPRPLREPGARASTSRPRRRGAPRSAERRRRRGDARRRGPRGRGGAGRVARALAGPGAGARRARRPGRRPARRADGGARRAAARSGARGRAARGARRGDVRGPDRGPDRGTGRDALVAGRGRGAARGGDTTPRARPRAAGRRGVAGVERRCAGADPRGAGRRAGGGLRHVARRVVERPAAAAGVPRAARARRARARPLRPRGGRHRRPGGARRARVAPRSAAAARDDPVGSAARAVADPGAPGRAARARRNRWPRHASALRADAGARRVPRGGRHGRRPRARPAAAGIRLATPLDESDLAPGDLPRVRGGAGAGGAGTPAPGASPTPTDGATVRRDLGPAAWLLVGLLATLEGALRLRRRHRGSVPARRAGAREGG